MRKKAKNHPTSHDTWGAAYLEFQRRCTARGYTVDERTRDATEKWLFEITREDINDATPKDTTTCVMALSMGRSSEKKTTVCMSHSTLKEIDWDHLWITRYVVMDKKLRRAIKTFDKTGKWDIQPGYYWLSPPKANNKLVKNMSEEEKARRKETNRLLRINYAHKKENGLPHGKLSQFNGRDITRIINPLPRSRPA